VTSLADVVQRIEVGDAGRTYLLERWLDQVEWLGRKAAQAQRRYYALRLTTGVGAVIVASLAGIATRGGTLGDAARIAVFAIGLTIALSAAVEQLFRYGERWHHYRQAAEALKTEGWLFFQLAGPYGGEGATHAAALPAFAQRVENLLKSDVDTYVTEVTADPRSQSQS
jgi:hypothetical protein